MRIKLIVPESLQKTWNIVWMKVMQTGKDDEMIK